MTRLHDEVPCASTADLSTSRQRELLGDLLELIERRAREETALKALRSERDQAAVEEFERDRDAATATCRQETEQLRLEYTEALEAVMRHHDTQRVATNQEIERRVARIKHESEAAVKAARRERLVATQEAKDEYERTIQEPRKRLEQFRGQCEQYRIELAALDEHARGILRRRRCGGLVRQVEAPAETAGRTPPMERYAASVASARQLLQELSEQKTAKFLEEGWPFLLLLFFWAAAIYPAGSLLGWSGAGWILASGAAGIGLTLLITLVVYPIVRRQTASRYPAFEAARREAQQSLARALSAAESDARREQKWITERRDGKLQQTETRWERVSNQLANDHRTRIETTDEEYEARKQNLQQTRDRDLQQLNDKYPPRIDARQQLHQRQLEELERRRDEALETNRQEFDAAWNDLTDRWTRGVRRFQQAVDAMNLYCDQHFPDWNSIDWSAWQPPSEAIEALRFGSYRVDLASFENGIPADPELQPARTRFDLPAVLTFPQCPSILLRASDEGREVAVSALQNLMLRLLTSMPPGKVRYTILDATGLGQNFSAFMHLADFDDKLVTNRIWTETAHINQRLLDLTEHMEKVIQKYLRNEFESIQRYNEHAGEVAEPFQILVVANFPAGFSDEAARRLLSITGSGPRCGVYALISTDEKLSLPRNFDMADLEAKAATMTWREGHFRWKDALLESLPLTLEQPPPDAAFTSAVKAAGQFAKDSSRVEVPFEAVAPQPEQWWSEDSRREIHVPLGRAGATKLQAMRLGHGTSQHVLISGKTGSGKSTLLHALITNLALLYSPDEVEFYLIDFKKGVEFRPYAALRLPHARVIAIESEREFGLSVLERLDEELKRRGDMFRALGVQNLAAYRDAQPTSILPRVLLVIDEFQELFVKDDKLAQDASLLLDRLVRQGRAFGIHVLLGSQTLAGAYSLARSTIGQMAVRIALQCSESDAHLILSEDNTAARLLSRPGEAIYNDANGLLEGNHPFQVVWLPDAEREYYLRELAAKARAGRRRPPPIVFEGNVAADPASNPQLEQLLESTLETPAAPTAWLGAAVAIKEPTSVTFRRQTGSNLLVVGQQEEMAIGVLATSLVSLAAAMPSADAARFFLLDGTHPEAPTADFWPRLAELLPLQLQPAAPRRAADVLGWIDSELRRRRQEELDSEPPIYLFVHNLSRFRDLKKSEDDFGFSMDDDAEPKPGKQFTTVLRDGPAFGIHTVAWCDTFNNVNRWLDRQTLRDIEMRVLFQMGATDSSNLMDSPEASRLGLHRAILYSEELGQWEKFRPYGPPEETWLLGIRRKLNRRWQAGDGEPGSAVGSRRTGDGSQESEPPR